MGKDKKSDELNSSEHSRFSENLIGKTIESDQIRAAKIQTKGVILAALITSLFGIFGILFATNTIEINIGGVLTSISTDITATPADSTNNERDIERNNNLLSHSINKSEPNNVYSDTLKNEKEHILLINPDKFEKEINSKPYNELSKELISENNTLVILPRSTANKNAVILLGDAALHQGLVDQYGHLYFTIPDSLNGVVNLEIRMSGYHVEYVPVSVDSKRPKLIDISATFTKNAHPN